MQELGVTEVEKLSLDWLYLFLTAYEQDRLTGWNLGVRPYFSRVFELTSSVSKFDINEQ